MMNWCNSYRTDGKRNDCYYHILAMAAYFNERVAAIVVSVLYRMLTEKLRGHVRVKCGQSMEPSVGIMDSQSVRWGNNASLNGIDGNKKVKGIKRHVIVDKNGFLIAVMVTIANVHDSKAAYLLMRVLKEMCSSVRNILADGGYRGELVDNIRKKFGYVIQVVISAYKEQ